MIAVFLTWFMMPCGYDIIRTWTVNDQCDNSVTLSQVIEVEPADEAQFVNPPQDASYDCDNIPDMEVLAVTNSQTGICEISGTVNGVQEIEECTGIITRVWTFTDECGRQIVHIK